MASKIFVAVQFYDDETVSITFEKIPIEHVDEMLRRLGTDDIREQFVQYVQSGHRQKWNAVWEHKLEE